MTAYLFTPKAEIKHNNSALVQTLGKRVPFLNILRKNGSKHSVLDTKNAQIVLFTKADVTLANIEQGGLDIELQK